MQAARDLNSRIKAYQIKPQSSLITRRASTDSPVPARCLGFTVGTMVEPPHHRLPPQQIEQSDRITLRGNQQATSAT